MTTLNATEARRQFADLLNRVAYRGERIIIKRRGRRSPVVLVPEEDLKLLEALEDEMDARAARKALREGGFIPWEKVKAELGLQ